MFCIFKKWTSSLYEILINNHVVINFPLCLSLTDLVSEPAGQVEAFLQRNPPAVGPDGCG